MTQWWDYWSAFQLRLMSAAGAQLYTWAPLTSAVWFTKLEVTYDEELEDRETVGGTRYPSTRGWRAHLKMTLETVAGHFAGYGSSDTLEHVISYKAANVGSYYEIRLMSNPSSDWKRVNLLNGWKPETLGKNSALRVTLEFEGAALQTNAPARDYSSLAIVEAW